MSEQAQIDELRSRVEQLEIDLRLAAECLREMVKVTAGIQINVANTVNRLNGETP